MSYVPRDLYDSATMTWDGAVDSGKGAGAPKPKYGGDGWQWYGLWPTTGLTSAPVDYFSYGGYLYVFYNATDGAGRSVARFAVADDGTMTLDGSAITIGAGLGMAGIWSEYGCAHLDPSDGSVILVTYNPGGTGNTPIVKKYLCSAWPWTPSNHVWSSSLQQAYGSYVAGQYHARGSCYRTASKFYLASRNAGQVVTLDPSDGSVLGNWVYSAAWSALYPFQFLGVTAAGLPVGGSYHSAGGNQNFYAWDDSSPSAWTPSGDPLVESSGATNWWVPHSKRVARRAYSTYFYILPLSMSERAHLGLGAGEMAFWTANRATPGGEPLLVVFDPSLPASEQWSDRPYAVSSTRRSIGNHFLDSQKARFVQIGGKTWIVAFSVFTLDIEDANPGGDAAQQIGLVLMPVGPFTVTYKFDGEDETPLGLAISIEKTAVHYLNSDSRQKHRFRYRVNGGTWSVFRCGEQEISNLAEEINGKPAWAWSDGDEVEIQHDLGAGWPYAWDQTIKVNPGWVTDPDSPAVTTADVAPPREVRVVLWVETGALTGLGNYRNLPGTITSEELVTTIEDVQEV